MKFLSLSSVALSLLLSSIRVVSSLPGTEAMIIDSVSKLSLGAEEAAHSAHDLLSPVAMEIDDEVPSIIAQSPAIPKKKSTLAPPPSKSVIRPSLFEHDGISQGQLGSCHIFSTQALMKDATGVSVSVARMFLDHLLNVGGSNPGSIDPTKDPKSQIAALNVDHVLEERTKTAADHCKGGFFNWEAGWIHKDLSMLQNVGGVIVPDNTDYKDVEAVMRKLDQERVTMIRADKPLLRSSKTKLTQSGLSQIVEKALDPTHQGRVVAGDREFVKSVASKYTVQSVDFHGSVKATKINIRKRVNELVKRLETNAVVLAVDTDKYWPAVYENKHVKVTNDAVFPTDSSHVIILAGYEISDDTFFVRDSNFKKVIAVKAQDIVLSTEWAGFYKQIEP